MLGVRQGEVGPDPRVLQGHDVLDRPELGVPDRPLGAHPPPEAHPPEEVQHRLALPHVAGGRQGVEDDPGAAPVDDVVGLVAQHGPAAARGAHERGVRVGAADPLGREPPVARGQGARRVEAAALEHVPPRGLEDAGGAGRRGAGRAADAGRPRGQRHHGRWRWRGLRRRAGGCLVTRVAALGEQRLEVVADDPPQPGDDGVHVGVGPHPRGVEEAAPCPTPGRPPGTAPPRARRSAGTPPRPGAAGACSGWSGRAAARPRRTPGTSGAPGGGWRSPPASVRCAAPRRTARAGA